MTPWLEPLRAELAGCTRSGRWFFRDDDAGWDDARLFALVDVFRAAGGHVDLAAIPAATSFELGRRLSRLVDEGCITVHQHGCAHVDHEPQGRKCEFGPSRPRAAQRRDLVCGRRLLAERLEGRSEPFFTPPWNRCTAVTAELLAALGFSTLSADRSAPRRDVAGLAEIPVGVDWTRAWSRGGRPALVDELCRAVRRGDSAPDQTALGVMLHHAVMDAGELAALRDLLALLADTPAVLGSSIRALLDERTLTPVSPVGHGSPSR